MPAFENFIKPKNLDTKDKNEPVEDDGPIDISELGPGEQLEERAEPSQLLSIIADLKKNPTVYSEVTKELLEANPEKFANPNEIDKMVNDIRDPQKALGFARLVDTSLGKGTFRTLSFLSGRQDASRNVLKLLQHNRSGRDFEKQVERGYYLNLLENYGVEWNRQKVARDILQNFFDANGHTLDGIAIETEPIGPIPHDSRANATVNIRGSQDYDWRELLHFGGTTKKGSETDVGGFGEGIKVAAFVLLRDHGAESVKVSSRDWEIEYYFDDMARGAYGKESRGFYARKRKKPTREGNAIEIKFSGEGTAMSVHAFEDARDFFYSSENKDFQDASFNNPESGGFKVLPNIPMFEDSTFTQTQKGRVYLAGQRTHYISREDWDTVPDVNIWTWKKVQPKDRDRGMLTREEMVKQVVPMVVNSMTTEELKKSVYDFEALWNRFTYTSIGDEVCKRMVDRLHEKDVTLEFPPDCVANDMPTVTWLVESMKDQGYRVCASYFDKVGMKKMSTKFKELLSHTKVEANEQQKTRIEVLKRLGEAIGLEPDEIKDVWMFSMKDEKSIIEGQYNGMFYWMSTDLIDGKIFEAINTYAHEAAHKKGPHGKAEFEYYLENCKQKITKFILEHKPEWDEYEREWNEAW